MVDTVRLARELRRHGASVSVMMTHSAHSKSHLWLNGLHKPMSLLIQESDLSALDEVDGILISPATETY